MCLAQEHNTMTHVRLEPLAPRCRVKHSTTEPLRSLDFMHGGKLDLSLPIHILTHT